MHSIHRGETDASPVGLLQLSLGRVSSLYERTAAAYTDTDDHDDSS